MKNFYLIIFLSLAINIQFIEFAQAIPGSFFRNIFKFFKGGTDDVMKNAEDLIRNNWGGSLIILRPTLMFGRFKRKHLG